jgi:protein SCO1/2
MGDLTRRNFVGRSALTALAGGLLTSMPGGVLGQAAQLDRKRFANSTLSPREKIRQRYFPDVVLRTHLGKEVRFYEDLMKGKIVTINFVYASCEGVCPAIMTNLVKVQKLLGDRVGRDIFMYSFTLQPEKDTPQVLKEYAEMHGVKPGWTFLTGKPADLELLRRRLGFTNPNPEQDKDKSNHIGNIRYGNEPLMLWAACPGLAHAKWIAESISWVIRPEQPGKA